MDHDDGTFALCLPFTFLTGQYADYCQEAFDNYAKSIGDPVYNDIGLRTHGNGYEWEAAFRQIFRNDPNIGRVLFDCEAGGFFCSCNDLDIIEDFGIRFKDLCEDTQHFTEVIAEGIQYQEAWEKEQEQLMKGNKKADESIPFHRLKPYLASSNCSMVVNHSIKGTSNNSVLGVPSEDFSSDATKFRVRSWGFAKKFCKI